MQNFAGSAADQNLIRLQLFACGDGGTELLGIFVMIAAGASQHLSHGVDRKLGRSIGILVGVQQYKLAQVPAPGAALRVGSFASNGQASGYQSKSTCEIAASQHEASWFRMIPQEGRLPSRGHSQSLRLSADKAAQGASLWPAAQKELRRTAPLARGTRKASRCQRTRPHREQTCGQRL